MACALAIRAAAHPQTNTIGIRLRSRDGVAGGAVARRRRAGTALQRKGRVRLMIELQGGPEPSCDRTEGLAAPVHGAVNICRRGATHCECNGIASDSLLKTEPAASATVC